MERVLSRGVWMAAIFVGLAAAALAQEVPPAKPAPPKGPDAEYAKNLVELNQRISRMVVEAAQANPELKAMHEAQQAKWRAANQKRAEIIASNPDIKKMQDDLQAKRRKQRELSAELISKNPELAEMQKQLRELRQKLDEKVREAVSASPEVAALFKETQEIQDKIAETLRNDPDLLKMNAETDATWNELVKKAAAVSPDIAKALEECNVLRKAAATPPAPKPKEKEEPK